MGLEHRRQDHIPQSQASIAAHGMDAAKTPPSLTFNSIPIPEKSSKRRPSPWTLQSSESAWPPSPSNSRVGLLARQALKKAFEEGRGRADEAAKRSDSQINTGITVDLSHNSITALPEDAIDIINHNLERLALCHNLLTTLPPRLSLCQSLRYLNLRHNAIMVFPEVLCEMRSLEILDISKNRIKRLPDSIANLSSLKVLALQRNAIESLPLCLADMTLLCVLKFEGNPVEEQIQHILRQQFGDAIGDGRENESVDVTTTILIKQFLRSQSPASAWTSSPKSGNAPGKYSEVARGAPKRDRGVRFPVKVNGTETIVSPRPSLSALPHRSTTSQNNIGLRSLETRQATVGDNRKYSQSVSEMSWPHEKNRNYSHPQHDKPKLSSSAAASQDWRTPSSFDKPVQCTLDFGFSEAMAANTRTRCVPQQGGLSVEELRAILPPKPNPANPTDSLMEVYRTVFFSVYQLHWLVHLLVTLLGNSADGNPSIQALMCDADSYLSTLGRLIEHESQIDRGNLQTESVAYKMQLTCLGFTKTYSAVCLKVASNAGLLVDTGDARYIRHLLSLLHSSVVGLRCAFDKKTPRQNSTMDTMMPKRQPTSIRKEKRRVVHQELAVPQYLEQRRTKKASPIMPAMISLDTSACMKADAIRGSRPSKLDPDLLQFYHIIEKSSSLVLNTLPDLYKQYLTGLIQAELNQVPLLTAKAWRLVVCACERTIQSAEALQGITSAASYMASNSRSPPWDLCYAFAVAWADLGAQFQQTEKFLRLSAETKSKLRQIQVHVKKLMNCMLAMSPNTPLHQPMGSLSTTQQAALGPISRATLVG